jgi:hypothetical protein
MVTTINCKRSVVLERRKHSGTRVRFFGLEAALFDRQRNEGNSRSRGTSQIEYWSNIRLRLLTEKTPQALCIALRTFSFFPPFICRKTRWPRNAKWIASWAFTLPYDWICRRAHWCMRVAKRSGRRRPTRSASWCVAALPFFACSGQCSRGVADIGVEKRCDTDARPTRVTRAVLLARRPIHSRHVPCTRNPAPILL